MTHGGHMLKTDIWGSVINSGTVFLPVHWVTETKFLDHSELTDEGNRESISVLMYIKKNSSIALQSIRHKKSTQSNLCHLVLRTSTCQTFMEHLNLFWETPKLWRYRRPPPNAAFSTHRTWWVTSPLQPLHLLWLVAPWVRYHPNTAVCGVSLFCRRDHDGGDDANLHLAYTAAWRNHSTGSHLWTQTDRWSQSPVWVQARLMWDQGHGTNPKNV